MRLCGPTSQPGQHSNTNSGSNSSVCPDLDTLNPREVSRGKACRLGMRREAGEGRAGQRGRGGRGAGNISAALPVVC